MKLKVHLLFPGTCEEAFNFYCQTLKGEVGFIFRKEEEKIAGLAEEDKGKIGYMEIKTPHFVIAGEDANHNEKVIAGNNTKLTLSFYDLSECRRVFDAFAANGTITMPFEKTFYSEGIGEVTDKYGISWIIMMSDDNYEG